MCDVFVGVERCGVTNMADGYDATENMLCLRKITVSSVALACRRVGSKRVKSLPSCKNKYYKQNKIDK